MLSSSIQGRAKCQLKFEAKKSPFSFLGSTNAHGERLRIEASLRKSVLMSFTKNTLGFIPNLSLLVTLDDLCVLIGNRIIRRDWFFINFRKESSRMNGFGRLLRGPNGRKSQTPKNSSTISLKNAMQKQVCAS